MRNTIVLSRFDLINPQQTQNIDAYSSFKNLSMQEVNKAYAIYFEDEKEVIVLKQKHQNLGIDPAIEQVRKQHLNAF